MASPRVIEVQDRSWRNIVAKHLTRPPPFLVLYFTIFLNQLDILESYTENGAMRPARWLSGAAVLGFSWQSGEEIENVTTEVCGKRVFAAVPAF